MTDARWNMEDEKALYAQKCFEDWKFVLKMGNAGVERHRSANSRHPERVNLSPTPVWRRIQRLSASGVITRQVALLDPEKIGFDITVFVEIHTDDHSAAWLNRFAEAVAGMPEVMEVYRMAGEIDYILRVSAPSMAAFDGFYRRLIARVPLRKVTSRFAMERVKFSTSYNV